MKAAPAHVRARVGILPGEENTRQDLLWVGAGVIHLQDSENCGHKLSQSSWFPFKVKVWGDQTKKKIYTFLKIILRNDGTFTFKVISQAH